MPPLSATFVLFLFFSYFVPFVATIHPHALNRRQDKSHDGIANAISSRQHHEPRALIDLCLSTDLKLLTDALGLVGIPFLGTDVHICLCLKDLDIFLDTDVNAKFLVALLGKDVVAAAIRALINTSDSRECSLPPNSHRTCNNSDPCHYSCDDHYSRDGDSCVCALPYTVCNGICGNHPHGCVSSTPGSLKTRSSQISNLSQAKVRCKANESLCGIAGREDTLSFECIDTSVTKNSCGGCTTPHPFVDVEGSSESPGQNCGSIPNAQATKCINHKCAIMTCKNGWAPDQPGTECVPTSATRVKLRMMKKRVNSETILPSAIDSNLLAKIVLTVNLVAEMHTATASSVLTGGLDSSVKSESFSTAQALDAVIESTAVLITSTSSHSLLNNINDLAGFNTILRSTLEGCGCVDSLGLGALVDYTVKLSAAILDLQTWCNLNPIIPSDESGQTLSGNYTTDLNITTAIDSINAPGSDSLQVSGGPMPSIHGTSFDPANAPDVPIVLGLNDLLAKLGLGALKSGVRVYGLGPDLSSAVNNIFDDFGGIGPANSKRVANEKMNCDSVAGDLGNDKNKSADILAIGTKSLRRRYDFDINSKEEFWSEVLNRSNALVDLVINLQSNSSLLHDTAYGSSDNASLIVSIIRATVKLVTSDDTNLEEATEDLVTVSLLAGKFLLDCQSVDGLNLGPLMATLENIIVTSLDLRQLYCAYSGNLGSFAIGDETGNSGTGAKPHLPIIVGLSKLLKGLGLGGNKTGITVDGLGGGINDYSNSMLNDLGIGPNGLRRRTNLQPRK